MIAHWEKMYSNGLKFTLKYIKLMQANVFLLSLMDKELERKFRTWYYIRWQQWEFYMHQDGKTH